MTLRHNGSNEINGGFRGTLKLRSKADPMAFILPIDELLAASLGEFPCGVMDPACDAQVSALLSAIRGKPARTTLRNGQTVVVRQAEEPNWQLLRTTAEALFLGKEAVLLSPGGASTNNTVSKPVKHLGAAMVLALSALQTNGIVGFADGLVLVDRLLDEYWDTLYPLPARDSKDPFYARANLLSPLGAEIRSLNDSWRFVERLFAVNLIESPQYGRLSVRDCLSSRPLKPRMDLPAGDPVPEETVAAARLDVLKDLEKQQAALRDAIRAAQRIEKTLKEKAPQAAALKLEQLLRVLNEAAAVLDGPGADPITGLEIDEGKRGPDLQTSLPGVTVSGAITSREQAVLMLAKVADYFAKREPSSPIPQILERARRLAGMNFLSILQDLELGQEAVPAFKKLAGMPDDSAAQDQDAHGDKEPTPTG